MKQNIEESSNVVGGKTEKTSNFLLFLHSNVTSRSCQCKGQEGPRAWWSALEALRCRCMSHVCVRLLCVCVWMCVDVCVDGTVFVLALSLCKRAHPFAIRAFFPFDDSVSNLSLSLAICRFTSLGALKLLGENPL
jgi:hypothetical protein